MDDSLDSNSKDRELSELTNGELEKLIEQKVREELEKESDGGIPLSRRSLLGLLGIGAASVGTTTASEVTHQEPAIDDDSLSDFEVSTLTTQRIDTTELKINDDGPAESFNEIRPPREVYVVWHDGSDYRATSDSFPNYQDPNPESVIQAALDELDGTVTGYDSDGNAARPGGGAVLLTRGHYEITSPIVLRKGTRLVGTQPDLLLGKNNHEYQYCIIRPTSDFTGNALIKTQGNHVGLHNLVIGGKNVDATGVKNEAASSYFSNLVITHTDGVGLWNEAMDFWLESCTVKVCGDATTPAVSAVEGFRWKYGRISNDDGYSAVVTQPNSGLVRFKNCTIKSSEQPASKPMPVVNHGGNLLELNDCVIDGYNGTGSYGIQQTSVNQLRLYSSLLEKCDIALYLDGNDSTRLNNVKIRAVNRHGIYVDGLPGNWNSIHIADPNDSGVVVDDANIFGRWHDLKISGWNADGDGDGYAIDIRGVKGGQPGDVPVITGLDIGDNDLAAAINNPDLCVVDGEWVVPYTYFLNGTDGSINVSNKSATTTHIRINAGGSASTLQGINGPTRATQTLILEHSGSNNVTLEHRSSSASVPLANKSGQEDVLSSNGELVGYRYDAQSGLWRQMWINTQ